MVLCYRHGGEQGAGRRRRPSRATPAPGSSFSRAWTYGAPVTDMSYRRLGSSGLVVSTVGLRCTNFGRRLGLDDTRAVVDAALAAGITFLDTAHAYRHSGRPLREVLQGRRDAV